MDAREALGMLDAVYVGLAGDGAHRREFELVDRVRDWLRTLADRPEPGSGAGAGLTVRRKMPGEWEIPELGIRISRDSADGLNAMVEVFWDATAEDTLDEGRPQYASVIATLDRLADAHAAPAGGDGPPSTGVTPGPGVAGRDSEAVMLAREAARTFGGPTPGLFNTAGFQAAYREAHGTPLGDVATRVILDGEPRIVQLSGGCHWLLLPERLERERRKREHDAPATPADRPRPQTLGDLIDEHLAAQAAARRSLDRIARVLGERGTVEHDGDASVTPRLKPGA